MRQLTEPSHLDLYCLQKHTIIACGSERVKAVQGYEGCCFISLFLKNNLTYCPFDISRKDVFCLAFILNENILFWLTISNQKPFVFSVSVFCSQIFTVKLNLRPKIGLTYAISIVKWFFGVFVYENIFYFSLLNLNYWCFTTILWKFQKNWTSGTCWKSASKLPTLQISAKFAFIFSIGKCENIWFFKIQWIE